MHLLTSLLKCVFMRIFNLSVLFICLYFCICLFSKIRLICFRCIVKKLRVTKINIRLKFCYFKLYFVTDFMGSKSIFCFVAFRDFFAVLLGVNLTRNKIWSNMLYMFNSYTEDTRLADSEIKFWCDPQQSCQHYRV